MSEAETTMQLGESSARASRRDDERYSKYLEEEQRRGARRGPPRWVVVLAEHI